MGCAQHAASAVIDDGCEECVVADRAVRWVEWFDQRIALLDAQSAQLADDLQAVTAARDEIAEAIEHGRLDRVGLTATVTPFLAPQMPVPGVAAFGVGPPLGAGSRTAPAPHPAGGVTALPSAGPGHPLSPAALLSAAGAALLLIAAIVFTAVSWRRLGTGGQITVMLSATVLTLAVTVVCQRRRLRWTAEALSWLTAALAVVDVVAAVSFDLVLGDAAPEIVIAVASVAVVSVGLVVALLTNSSDVAVAEPLGSGAGAIGSMGGPSITADMRAHVSGHSLVGPWVQGPLGVMVGSGALAVRLGELRWAPVTAAVAALLIVGSLQVRPAIRTWWAAPAIIALVASVVVSLVQIDGTAVPLIYATTVSLLVVALGAWAYRCRTDPRGVPFGSVASLLVVFLLPVVHVARCDTGAQYVIVAALAVASVAASFSGAVSQRRVLSLASTVPLFGALVAMLDRAGTGTAAVAAVAVCSVAWVRHVDGRREASVVGVLAVIALVGYGPAAAGLDIGWSAAISAGVAVLGTTAALQWWARRSDAARTSMLVPVMSCSVLAAVAATAVSTATTAAFVTVLFITAVAAVVTTLTVGVVAVRWGALAVASAAFALGWLVLLADLDVMVMEAFSLPIGVVWGAAGLLGLSRDARLRSWPALGPGLLAASLPTVSVLMSGDDGITRMMTMLVIGSALAVAGGYWKQQAPLVVGLAAAVFAALTQAAPWAAGLPRWLSLGVVGAALLVAGARFESVRAGTRRATERLTHFR